MATFGPVDLHRDSASFGRITSTPKPGWANSDLLGPLHAAFPDIPLAIDTDVNGAALGEHRWGAARGLTDFVYITMGTGIGGGGMSGGKLLHGLVHPEIGHMRLPRLPGDDFAGVCPYHGDCWEGSVADLRSKRELAAQLSTSRPTTTCGGSKLTTLPPHWQILPTSCRRNALF